MVVKIVNDALVETLGSDADPISLEAVPPVAILMVGLQGSGKTTTTAKIAKRLTDRNKKKVLLASLDTRRPAAMEQLRILAGQVKVEFLPIVAGQNAVEIARRAMDAARLGGFDVVILDTAGRTTVDEALMAEAAEVKAATNPHEVLLVVDALTGQDAVNTATAFNERLGVTGIVMTRVDGDGRGGAALSMRAVTGKPIKLIGVGEKVDALEDFHPSRIANRILGMGDIVSLVEKAAESINAEDAAAMAAKIQKGKFDLEDMKMQLQQMEKLGGLGGVMGMMPGVGKIKDAMENAKIDDKLIKRQVAIINSMTAAERKNPDILKHSRKTRIAKGSGTSSEEINKLLKMHRGMAEMMKMMQGKKGGGLMGKLGSMMGLGRRHAGRDGRHALAGADRRVAGQDGWQGGGGMPGLPKGFTPPGGLPGLGKPGFRALAAAPSRCCRAWRPQPLGDGGRRSDASLRGRDEAMQKRPGCLFAGASAALNALWRNGGNEN